MNLSDLLIFYVGYIWGKYDNRIRHYIFLFITRIKQYFKEKRKEHEEWERRF